MEATVRWLSPMSFVAETGSGHAIVLDGAAEHGGRDLGARPMEMLLVGLGSCSSFDVMLMLQKGRQKVTDCQAFVTAERADTEPKVFTKINLHFVVVINFALSRIIAFTAVGSSLAPARSASWACRASSLIILATISRLRSSSTGRRWRCPSRCSTTWCSVSLTKPKLQ